MLLLPNDPLSDTLTMHTTLISSSWDSSSLVETAMNHSQNQDGRCSGNSPRLPRGLIHFARDSFKAPPWPTYHKQTTITTHRIFINKRSMQTHSCRSPIEYSLHPSSLKLVLDCGRFSSNRLFLVDIISLGVIILP